MDIEQKIEKNSQILLSFIAKNKSLFLAIFLTGCFAYGYEITNMTFGIDEELLWQYPESQRQESWMRQSRWGMIAYLRFLLPAIEYPFVSCVTGILFLSLAYTLWLSAHHNAGTMGKAVFGCLAISFPTFAHVQQFAYMGAFVACSVFLVFAAYYVFTQATGSTVSRYLVPIFILAFAASTHQSVIYIFFIPFLFDALSASMNRSLCYKYFVSQMVKMLVITASAIILYFCITISLRAITGISSSGYVERVFILFHHDAIVTINRIFHAAKSELSGNTFTYQLMYAIIFPVAYILFTTKDKVQTFVIILIIFIYYIFYNAVFGWWQPSRSRMFLPVFFAGFFYLAFGATRNLGKMCIVIFSIYAILLHSSIITRLFMTDAFARKRDYLIASRITNYMYDVHPSFISSRTPVAFIGFIPDSENILSSRRDREVFGGSFWQWDRGNPQRMRRYLTALGLPDFRVTGREENKKLAESETVRRMPAWPSSGFVKLHNGFLVVKLSETAN